MTELKEKYDLAASLIFKAKLLLDEVQPHLTSLSDSELTRRVRNSLEWAHSHCEVLGLHRIGEAIEDTVDSEAEFTPDWFSPPGDSVKDLLEHRKMSHVDFAIAMGKTESWVESFLQGDIELTEAIAQDLSKLLGSTKQFWLNRETTYRKDKKRITGN